MIQAEIQVSILLLLLADIRQTAPWVHGTPLHDSRSRLIAVVARPSYCCTNCFRLLLKRYSASVELARLEGGQFLSPQGVHVEASLAMVQQSI